MGMEIHSPSQKLICSGCGKKFTKDCDFRRHWRVPIPCQIPDCPKEFRDDKLKVYLNHHASEHYNYEQNGLTEVHLKSYFCGTHMLALLRLWSDADSVTDKGKELRHCFVENLCVLKTSNCPQSGIGLSRDTSGAATVLSTEPRDGFSNYRTIRADPDPPLPSLSTPETSIGSSPLAPIMNGLLNSPDVFLSSPQPTQLGTGLDYGMENIRPHNPHGPVPCLNELVCLAH
jgi:hypothetical protein